MAASIKELTPKCKLMVFQPEMAPTTGQVHLQGYVYLTQSHTLTKIKALFHPYNAHFEKAKGSHKENYTYCTKTESRIPGTEPFVFGDFTVDQGSRTDLTEIANAAVTSTLKVLAEQFPTHAIRYPNGLRFVHSLLHISQPGETRSWRTHVIVLWGPSGTGKSRRMIARLGELGIIIPRPTNGCAELTGYNGQENVGLDDFYGWLPYDFLIRLMDNTPMPIRILYGHTQWLARVLIVTSNSHPSMWYPNHPIPWYTSSTGEMSALHRRLSEPGNEVIHMPTVEESIVLYRQTHPLTLHLPPFHTVPAVSASFVRSSKGQSKSNKSKK